MSRLEYTPKNDVLFKMLFTRNENLLRSFVAGALGIEKASIRGLRVLNPELPPAIPGGKSCRLDVRMNVDGRMVDAEIQVGDEGNYRERSVYYLSRMFAESLLSGTDYSGLPETILISVINFNLFPYEHYHNVVKLTDSRGEVFTDKFVMHFYELPKTPTAADKNNLIELWLKFFGSETEEDLTALAETEVEDMQSAVTNYKRITADPQFREIQRMLEDGAHDEAQRLWNERRKEAVKIARGMLARNYPIEDVTALTGLDEADIKSI